MWTTGIVTDVQSMSFGWAVKLILNSTGNPLVLNFSNQFTSQPPVRGEVVELFGTAYNPDTIMINSRVYKKDKSLISMAGNMIGGQTKPNAAYAYKTTVIDPQHSFIKDWDDAAKLVKKYTIKKMEEDKCPDNNHPPDLLYLKPGKRGCYRCGKEWKA